jgi:hypothetical protein
MAMFVHIADARSEGAIRRAGIRANRFHLQPAQIAAGGPPLPRRAVFCVPVLPDIQASLQWLRELKARGNRTSCAVQFRLPDAEPVLAGHYRDWPRAMAAAEAVALFLRSPDPLGMQVLLPRAVAAAEIHRIREVRQVFGWRYFPGSHERRPYWPAPGSIKAARLRRRIDEEANGPW